MDPRIRITLKIIAEHGASIQLSLTETSNMLGLSEAYLLRLFHREFGKTFRRHLLEARMIRAADLVKESAQPMKQIALECGYSDTSNFYRDFRKIHGTPPRKFRTEHLERLTESPAYKTVNPELQTPSMAPGTIAI